MREELGIRPQREIEYRDLSFVGARPSHPMERAQQLIAEAPTAMRVDNGMRWP